MNQNRLLPPKERINIAYRSRDEGAGAETELPLKMLVVGDFTASESKLPIEERATLAINRERFDEVMASQSLSVAIEVPNHLAGKTDEKPASASSDTLAIALAFNKLADFSPENICAQSAPLQQLLELRQALVALKGPLGNFPHFRRKLEQILHDPSMRERLVHELSKSERDPLESIDAHPLHSIGASNSDLSTPEAP